MTLEAHVRDDAAQLHETSVVLVGAVPSRGSALLELSPVAPSSLRSPLTHQVEAVRLPPGPSLATYVRRRLARRAPRTSHIDVMGADAKFRGLFPQPRGGPPGTAH